MNALWSAAAIVLTIGIAASMASAVNKIITMRKAREKSRRPELGDIDSILLAIVSHAVRNRNSKMVFNFMVEDGSTVLKVSNAGTKIQKDKAESLMKSFFKDTDDADSALAAAINKTEALGGSLVHETGDLDRDSYVLTLPMEGGKKPARPSLPVIHETSSEVSGEDSEKADFLEGFNRVIEEHMAESNLTTTELAQYMSTSRQALSARIQEYTGLSTLEYLRLSRLKKAQQLISEGKYRVSEIAYMVGYSSPSYFTRHFHAEFGYKPTDITKRGR